MQVARTLSELCAARALVDGEIGFVPTMGALHEGHLALVKAASASQRKVAVSIFVNPLQFGTKEDFSRYPRDGADDLAKLEAAGCNLVWLPAVTDIYIKDGATTVSVAGPVEYWEAAMRPGHFTGVATVVTKLFGHVRPNAAFFGEKDWQQIQVISRLVKDLVLPVEIVTVPTVRELDGLAMSSRNRFLLPSERKVAPAIFAALSQAAADLAGKTSASAVCATDALRQAQVRMEEVGMRVDYVALVDAESLKPLNKLTHPAQTG